MCYKDERERKDMKAVSEKIKDYPVFIQNYFDDLRSNSTKRAYFSYINGLLEWLLENKKIKKDSIADIMPEDIGGLIYNDIIKYLDSLLMAGAAVTSIKTKLNVFKSFWRYLVDSDYVSKNIVSKIPANKYKVENASEVIIPEPKQIKQLLMNIISRKDTDTERNMAIVVLFAATGMRCEELMGLDIDSIWQDGNGQWYAKTKRKGNLLAYSNIWIRPEAAEYIEKYLTYRKTIKADTNALFVSAYRNRVSKHAIDNIFEKCSGGNIHCHLMRHLFATDMYAKTRDIVYVQKLLGHASCDTTSNMYVSVKHKKDFFTILKEVMEK